MDRYPFKTICYTKNTIYNNTCYSIVRTSIKEVFGINQEKVEISTILVMLYLAYLQASNLQVYLTTVIYNQLTPFITLPKKHTKGLNYGSIVSNQCDSYFKYNTNKYSWYRLSHYRAFIIIWLLLYQDGQDSTHALYHRPSEGQV